MWAIPPPNTVVRLLCTGRVKSIASRLSPFASLLTLRSSLVACFLPRHANHLRRFSAVSPSFRSRFVPVSSKRSTMLPLLPFHLPAYTALLAWPGCIRSFAPATCNLLLSQSSKSTAFSCTFSCTYASSACRSHTRLNAHGAQLATFRFTRRTFRRICSFSSTTLRARFTACIFTCILACILCLHRNPYATATFVLRESAIS